MDLSVNGCFRLSLHDILSQGRPKPSRSDLVVCLTAGFEWATATSYVALMVKLCILEQIKKYIHYIQYIQVYLSITVMRSTEIVSFSSSIILFFFCSLSPSPFLVLTNRHTYTHMSTDLTYAALDTNKPHLARCSVH